MIRELQQRGWSQQAIGKAVGCGQSLISDLLRGRRGKRLDYRIGRGLTDLWHSGSLPVELVALEPDE